MDPQNIPYLSHQNCPASEKLKISQLSRSQFQPRSYFDETAMAELTKSVKQHGVLHPIIVRPLGESRYELVAGERRYKAAKAAGLSEVPVVIQTLSDLEVVQYALMENLQREDLNPVEETEGILQLLELKLEKDREAVISLLNQMAKVKRGLADSAVRQEEQQVIEAIFQSIGRLSTEAFRTHRLPLLKLSPEILEALRQGRIEYTKAKEIAKLGSKEERVELLEAAIAQSFSLRQVQKIVKEKKIPKEEDQLKTEINSISKRFSRFKAWNNPNKRAEIDELLKKLTLLLSEEEQ
ncbi:ParB/RepB/Spo0J family partition protein [Laspinema olomoucense]|uniref:ParB/RepB/Spo0J family partition protein n=1 Tax=Laspinema olomoucense D3b TaxID=2953688 RepID=A0ABT2N1E1_9CYAN|nr:MULTISPECIES: ParB/RepB/Spo0J family partition protein [unclassified Laspinema]MCT7976504.1 ParB/RepB/Spo0J family partition protein [Laspinema sp. D3b]MCT7994518.1 ParB/RepB/Spo0J family partition protein [Laspinema sp. D3c]